VGVLAPIGNVVAGTLGDRFGRKRTIVAGITTNALAGALFYNTGGIWIPPGWGAMLISSMLILVLFAALGTELFPTSYRSPAACVRWSPPWARRWGCGRKASSTRSSAATAAPSR